MKKAPETKALVSELITDNILGTFLNYMPNPDDIASGTRESYDTYRQMKNDPRIKSLLGKIKTLSLNFAQHFSQGENCPDAVYDFVRQIPLFRNMYKKQKRLLTALDYGFSVSEVIWQNPAENGGKWIPQNLITRRPERFVFDHAWNLYHFSNGIHVPLNQDYKWLVMQHDPDDENPYGTSVLRCVYWAWMFKRAGYEFWLQATEKFSVKSIIALFKSNGDETTLQRRANTIASMLLGIESGSASAVANVDSIHELSMSGSLNEFSELVEACDIQISYGLTGQSVATSRTNGGSLALGEVQADLFYEDCKGIALEIQNVMQKLVDWVVLLNFGEGVEAPQLEVDVAKKASFDEVCRAIEHGVPVSRTALYDEYHLPRPANEEDAFVQQQPAGITLADSDGKDVKKNFQFF